MEPIKHFEWVLSIFFIIYGYLGVSITFDIILFLALGSQLPDVLEFLFCKLRLGVGVAKDFSHSLVLPIVVLLGVGLVQMWPSLFVGLGLVPIALYYVMVAWWMHLLIDTYSGRENLTPFYPFLKNWQFRSVSDKLKVKLGQLIERYLGDFVDTETNEMLAWFWLMQVIATTSVFLSFMYYLGQQT